MVRIIPTFQGKIENGKLLLPDEEFSRYKKFCFTTSGDIQFILKKSKFWKKNRKYEKYYWSVVLPLISQSTGEEDLYRLHATFKSLFLKRMIELKGGMYEAVGSTRNMTSEQHGEFVEKVIKFAGEELQIEIPPPDPNYSVPILIEP